MIKAANQAQIKQQNKQWNKQHIKH